LDTRALHVAGLVVHARPESLDAVTAAIARLPRTAVHAVNPEGRLAIVLDADDAAGIAERHLAIGGLHGVMAASLVYEHHEELDE
jgi:nitrate reductase NapD